MDNISKKQKDWWAPVWRGLVVDSEGKHYRRMKNAVWLFLFFVIHADRQSGRLKRKYRTVSLEMGMSANTVRKWLKVLKDRGYVKAKSNGRCLEIQILKWKPIGECPRHDTQSGRTGVPRVPQLGRSGRETGAKNSAHLSQNSSETLDANEILIKRDKLKSDIEVLDLSSNSFKGMDQIIRKYLLAFYLAKALDDEKGLPLYLSYSKRYPESLLIRVLEQVKQVPEEKIRKGRGALFNHLIQQHDHNSNQNSGN